MFQVFLFGQQLVVGQRGKDDALQLGQSGNMLLLCIQNGNGGPLPGYHGKPPMNTVFGSRYFSIPSRPHSRPMPLCFTPPNGASGVDGNQSLIATMPYSSSSYMRMAVLRLPVCT